MKALFYDSRGKDVTPKIQPTPEKGSIVDYEIIISKGTGWAHALLGDHWVTPDTHDAYRVEYTDPDGCSRTYWTVFSRGYVGEQVQKNKEARQERNKILEILQNALGEDPALGGFLQAGEGDQAWGSLEGNIHPDGTYRCALYGPVPSHSGMKPGELRVETHERERIAKGESPDTWGYCHGTDFEGGEW